MNIKCPFSETRKQGLVHYKVCKLNNDAGCPYIRRCITGMTVEHSKAALNCEHRLKEELKER